MSLDLNPAQQEVVALLGASREAWPAFDPALRAELRADLEDGLAPLAEHVGERRLVISKHALTTVHGCEAHHVAAQGSFAWSVPVARGMVAHKAVELTVHWQGEWTPADAVDEALARLTESDVEPGPWLQARSRADLAELRGEATELVAKFLECFPPLRRQWRPVTEARLTVDLLDGQVRLSGKVDLTLGAPAGLRAGKVIVDLKTGAPSPAHRDDLRFYALLEALRLGVPPRRVATYYLDGGRAVVEDVTVDLLRAALARTVAGARLMVELDRAGRPPRTRPGPTCWWCPEQAGCEDGRRWLADSDP